MTENLTKEKFDEIFPNFENSPEWKYNGEKPAIIKFSTNWCGPCKAMVPIFKDLSEKMGEKVKFYEVNAGMEIDLPSMFKVNSVPTIIFFPVGENFIKKVGAIPQKEIEKIIEEKFKI